MAKINLKPPSWAVGLSDDDFKKMLSAKLSNNKVNTVSAAASEKGASK